MNLWVFSFSSPSFNFEVWNKLFGQSYIVSASAKTIHWDLDFAKLKMGEAFYLFYKILDNVCWGEGEEGWTKMTRYQYGNPTMQQTNKQSAELTKFSLIFLEWNSAYKLIGSSFFLMKTVSYPPPLLSQSKTRNSYCTLWDLFLIDGLLKM